jgi:hypothetical protein
MPLDWLFKDRKSNGHNVHLIELIALLDGRKVVKKKILTQKRHCTVFDFGFIVAVELKGTWRAKTPIINAPGSRIRSGIPPETFG